MFQPATSTLKNKTANKRSKMPAELSSTWTATKISKLAKSSMFKLFIFAWNLVKTSKQGFLWHLARRIRSKNRPVLKMRKLTSRLCNNWNNRSANKKMTKQMTRWIQLQGIRSSIRKELSFRLNRWSTTRKWRWTSSTALETHNRKTNVKSFWPRETLLRITSKMPQFGKISKISQGQNSSK